MSVPVTCPACGCHADIEAFFVDADAKRFAALFAELNPALGRAVLGYLRQFKSSEQALRVPRARRAVSYLLALVVTGEVRRYVRTGARRIATTQMWTQGIEQMIDQRDRLTLPIDNHNYLRAIVFGLAEQCAARAEAHVEEARRAGQYRSTASHGRIEAEGARDREIAWVPQIHSYGQIDDAERDRQLAAIAMKYQERT